MTEYTFVKARVEYVVQVEYWDYQNNCTDGTTKYGIFPTVELANQWFIDKGYVAKGNHWFLEGRHDITGEVRRRIVELDAEGYNV